MSANNSRSMLGKRHSIEARCKMSRAKKRLHQNGWKPANQKYSPGDIVGKDAAGYVMLYLPNYPHGRTARSRVFEHRYKAEQAIGRGLKRGEVVHHINGDKSDNRNSNLLVCSRKYHLWLHTEMARRYQRHVFAGESL